MTVWILIAMTNRTSRRFKRTTVSYFLYILLFLIGWLEKSVDFPAFWLAVLGVRLMTWKSAIWELIALVWTNQIAAFDSDFKKYIINSKIPLAKGLCYVRSQLYFVQSIFYFYLYINNKYQYFNFFFIIQSYIILSLSS